MWNHIAQWLRSAPIADAVDRRNAPVMQLLLLFYAIALPANWAWHLSSRPMPAGWTIVLLLDLATATLAFVSVTLIRHGRFRLAIKLFLGALLTSMALAYHKLGAHAQLIDQVSLILILVIAGLVLGRRALWTVFGLVMAIFAIGFVTDAYNTSNTAQQTSNILRNAPSLVLSYLIITAIIDRTITALRESLAESNARGHDLQREMAERERAQTQLIHAQKMEASGRLASGIAHDFNNILGVILGFSQQRHSLRELDDVAERTTALSDSLEGVEEAAARGITVTRKLLSFSRNDVLRIEVFDANHALVDLRPMLRQLFPPSVRIDLSQGDEPLPVRLDRSEFELMLLNIAANARDAMREGGQFRIATARVLGHVEIALADSGHGMDEHVRQRIFEPFFSTKAAADGTGLGLAVVHDLVKAVGGDIRADSAPGHGSVFTIRLPLATPAAADATAPDDSLLSLADSHD